VQLYTCASNIAAICPYILYLHVSVLFLVLSVQNSKPNSDKIAKNSYDIEYNYHLDIVFDNIYSMCGFLSFLSEHFVRTIDPSC